MINLSGHNISDESLPNAIKSESVTKSLLYKTALMWNASCLLAPCDSHEIMDVHICYWPEVKDPLSPLWPSSHLVYSFMYSMCLIILLSHIAAAGSDRYYFTVFAHEMCVIHAGSRCVWDAPPHIRQPKTRLLVRGCRLVCPPCCLRILWGVVINGS